MPWSHYGGIATPRLISMGSKPTSMPYRSVMCRKKCKSRDCKNHDTTRALLIWYGRFANTSRLTSRGIPGRFPPYASTGKIIKICLLFFLGCALVSSQCCSIAYRLWVVLDSVGARSRLMRPGVLMLVFVACFGRSGCVAYLMSWTELPVNVCDNGYTLT